MELIHFNAAHGEQLLEHLPDDDPRRDPRYIGIMSEYESAWSLIDGDDLIFSCGIYPIWDGVGEGWFLPSDLTEEYKFATVRSVNNVFDFVCEKFGITRVQATTDCEIPRDRKFLEVVGFEVESKLRQYGANGHDFWMMTRFYK